MAKAWNQVQCKCGGGPIVFVVTTKHHYTFDPETIDEQGFADIEDELDSSNEDIDQEFYCVSCNKTLAPKDVYEQCQ